MKTPAPGMAKENINTVLQAPHSVRLRRTGLKALGPRTYEKKRKANEKIIDPSKHIRSESNNPLIIAVDVTGSMASWPFEIFDRLPLLYNTLSQYREDLEICFAAIGDAAYDDWPLQVTTFASS